MTGNNAVQTRRLVAFIDTSGQPDVDEVATVTSVWCEENEIERLGTMLQHIRDMHRWQNSIRFSELGKLVGYSGGKAHVSLDWLNTVLYVPNFTVRVHTLAIKREKFDMQYYGNSRSKALNRLTKTNVLAMLPKLCCPGEPIAVKIYLDGHSADYAEGTGLPDYLRDTLEFNCERRSCQPQLLEIGVEPFPRSPLMPRGEKRCCQDMIALADLVAGVSRFLLAPQSTESVKARLANIMNDGIAAMQEIPVSARPLRLVEYDPPTRFMEYVVCSTKYKNGVNDN